MVDFGDGAPVAGDLDVVWDHGVPRGAPATARLIQVHAYDEHTFILRQSKTTSFEAPFLYLLMGNDRAVLFDTGATADPAKLPLRTTVDELLASWQARNARPAYHLVVAHSHAHGDHVAADDQFADRPDTTVVAHSPAAVQEFFGFTSWPDEVVRLDLGGRVLEVTGIPGHHPASIAVFDPWTGFLLTGDSVYPGRLYARDMAEFVASTDRLVEFAGARPVRHVMGCHIEMTRTPGEDYPMGTTYQPDEPPLQMAPDRLLAVRDAAHASTTRPGTHVFDDFIVFNWTGPTAMPRLMVRTLRQRLAARFGRGRS
jgi:glyoxylase-like metal-dependent hydrolase (beta-lactamase superfamily II)